VILPSYIERLPTVSWSPPRSRTPSHARQTMPIAHRGDERRLNITEAIEYRERLRREF